MRDRRHDRIGQDRFAVTLLEEVLLAGVPVLAIDPKGDLGNLALRFPDLAARDFAPWVSDGYVTSLLGLAGEDADPVRSPAHTLLSTLIERSWAHQRDLTLAQLIGQVLEQPLRKLGVFDLDTFYPADDRRALATN